MQTVQHVGSGTKKGEKGKESMFTQAKKLGNIKCAEKFKE